MQRCIAGDRSAWETLFRRSERGLEVSIRRTLQMHGAFVTQDRVEDIKGDLVVALVRDEFRKLRSFRGRCRLSAWLKVVAANYVVDVLRRRRPTVSLSGDTKASRHLLETLVDGSPSPHEELLDRRRVDFYRSIPDRLSREEQRFFNLFLEQGCSFEEIAETLETTIGAVYARKNRLRKRLMKMVLAEFGRDDE